MDWRTTKILINSKNKNACNKHFQESAARILFFELGSISEKGGAQPRSQFVLGYFKCDVICYWPGDETTPTSGVYLLLLLERFWCKFWISCMSNKPVTIQTGKLYFWTFNDSHSFFLISCAWYGYSLTDEPVR